VFNAESTTDRSEPGSPNWWFSELPEAVIAVVLDRVTDRAAHDLGNALLPFRAAVDGNEDPATHGRREISAAASSEIGELLTTLRAAMNGSALTGQANTTIAASKLWAELHAPIRLALPKGVALTKTLQIKPPGSDSIKERRGFRHAALWTCVSLAQKIAADNDNQSAITLEASLTTPGQSGRQLPDHRAHRWILTASRNSQHETLSQSTLPTHARTPDPQLTTPVTDPSGIDRVVDAWAQHARISITRRATQAAASTAFDIPEPDHPHATNSNSQTSQTDPPE